MNDPSKGSILIVDDNFENLEVLSRRLERKGYVTTCKHSGREALDVLEEQNFDLMLLDIMMPEMDGMEVLDKVRDRFSKSTLPVIMVTSKGDSEDVVDALNRGANDYIVKPVDFPVALARIQTQLSQREEVVAMSKTSIKYSLEIGRHFGQYLIKEKIGQGGMGAVYKVHDPALDRIVALKVVLPGQELTGAQIERFTREAKAIAKIKHPNIVGVHEIGYEPRNYFTMEFIEGLNLSQFIKEQSVSPTRAAKICLRIADALATAHGKGIVHRDIKPSNIMLDLQLEPHLMDFGLAKLDTEEEQLTRTGDILGTPEYMAPEQVDPSFGDIDSRSDLYSLGVILYELLTGAAPFSGTPIRILWQKLHQEPAPPSGVNPAVSPELEKVCLKAMERHKEDRFQNASDFHKALRASIT